jgi:hypothetical protein
MAFTSGLTMVIGCGPVMPLPEAPAATVPASDQALTRADSDGLDQPQRHPASAGSAASPASAAAAGPGGPPSAPESEPKTPDLANMPQREMPEAAHSRDDPTNVPQAETAEEGGFTGVYYDAYFGYLHLVRQGDSVTGRWRTDTGDAWGELTVVVGGLVPSLLIKQDATRRAEDRHVGTLDLDLGLDLTLLSDRRYASLTERLRAAGFTPDACAHCQRFFARPPQQTSTLSL